MEVRFRNSKLKKVFSSEKCLVREYGERCGKRAKLMVSALCAVRSLAQIRTIPPRPPYRLHELAGREKGIFSIDLVHPYRLLFKPDQEPEPRLPNKEWDFDSITIIKIIEVKDTHG